MNTSGRLSHHPPCFGDIVRTMHYEMPICWQCQARGALTLPRETVHENVGIFYARSMVYSWKKKRYRWPHLTTDGGRGASWRICTHTQSAAIEVAGVDDNTVCWTSTRCSN